MYHRAPISTRSQFGQLLRDRGLVSVAVEVGVHRAEFARVLLDSWPGRLFCVDPWANPPGYEEQAQTLRHIGGTGDREADYREALRVLRPFGGRAVCFRKTSRAAAPDFKAGQLDFVHVDGDHKALAVAGDLELWWPKLKAGGVLACHDWLCPGEEGGGWGKDVQPVVSRFAEFRRVDVWLVVEEGGLPWSCYMVKP